MNLFKRKEYATVDDVNKIVNSAIKKCSNAWQIKIQHNIDFDKEYWVYASVFCDYIDRPLNSWMKAKLTLSGWEFSEKQARPVYPVIIKVGDAVTENRPK